MNTRPGNLHDLPDIHRLDPAGNGLLGAAVEDGLAVVGEQSGRIMGYAASTSLPGLAGHHEFRVFVAPAQRRQGWGSRLVAELVALCGPAGVQLISCGVDDRAGPAARFLQSRRFFLEHTEWEMQRDLTGDRPPVVWPAGYALRTYPRREAIAHFRAVYEQAFAGLPSYQPYETEAEVDETLARAEDLRFVVAGDRPVGFVWARRVNEALGEIEPIGVAQGFQGQGLGRGLLAEGLGYLAERGCTQVRLGVWADNEPAIRLYQKFGFTQVDERYFFALEV